MGETTIEWTDAVWNPVRGCARVSPGCEGCYAERFAGRFAGEGLPYEGLVRLGKNGARWTGEARFVPEMLAQPLSWKKPRRVFVNSMSDLFHDDVTDEQIATIFGVMAACQQHTFQVLTKRPERMAKWFAKVHAIRADIWLSDPRRPNHDPRVLYLMEHLARFGPIGLPFQESVTPTWPLPNVWIGVSVEDQQRADERASVLVEVPAAVRFLSCEPLLERVDLWAFFKSKTRDESLRHLNTIGVPGIDWVIVGGESGPGARPCAVEWIEDVVAQCRRAEVAAFVKQTGSYVVSEHRTAPADLWPDNNRPPAVPGRPGEYWAWRAGLGDDKKGSTLESIADEFRVRMFPGDRWPAPAPLLKPTGEECPF